MLGQAIALGLVSALGRLDGRILGISMFDRPIVTATLAGLILGDPVKGVMIGAALELIYIGAIAIGAASPPDIVTGSILATSFAIISGQSTEAALALSVPIAMFGLTVGIVIRIITIKLFTRRHQFFTILPVRILRQSRADLKGLFILLPYMIA